MTQATIGARIGGRAALLLAGAAFFSLPTAAQDYGPRHYRAVAAVCQWEFDRHCPGLAPDSKPGLRCLARHFDALSIRCGRMLKAAAVIDACRPDHDRLCGFVVPGAGRVLACLRSNSDRLSPACSRTLRLATRPAGAAEGPRDGYDEELDGPVK